MNSQDEKQENIKKLKKNLNNLERIIQSQCNNTENLCKQTGFAVDSHAMEDAQKYAAAASKLALNAQIRMKEYRRHHEEMDKLQDGDKDEKEKLKKQLTDLEERVKKATNSASDSAELMKKIENPITLEILGSFATLSLKFATALGFLLLFISIFKTNWMPIGVSLSDISTFLILGLGVGVLIFCSYVIPSSIIYRTLDKLSQVFNNKQQNIIYKRLYIMFIIIFFIVYIMMFFAVFVILYPALIPDKISSVVNKIPALFIASIIIMANGYTIYLLGKGYFTRTDKKYVFYILLTLAFFPIIFGMFFFDKIILNSLGFSKPETAIQLSESDFKLVQAQVCQRKIANIKLDKENRIVWPVRVLLRGIGTHSLISFNNNEGKELRMEVKTDESKLINIPDKDIPKDEIKDCYNPNTSAPAAASAATSLEAITASTEAIYDDDKMNPNL